MNDQPQFKSRRELREAERAGLVEPVELPFDGVPRVEKAEVPIEPTGESLTRRQLRELEKTGGVLMIHSSQIQLPELPADKVVASDPAPALGEDTPVEPVQQESIEDAVIAEREEPITMAHPTVVSAVVDEQARADAIARAAAVANEFEAILNGAVVGSAGKTRKSKRTVLIVTSVILSVLVAGLLIAASVFGIFK